MEIGKSRPTSARDRMLAKMRSIEEFNSIGDRVRADMREACFAFLGRVPGPDEKIVDLIAEAQARDANTYCNKCGKPGLAIHACPYNEEVRRDPKPTCYCCDACTDKCAREI